MVKVGSDLVESAGFWGGFHKRDFPVLRMGAGIEGFEFGHGGVGAGNNGLADIDQAGLMFAESVEGLIDDPGAGGTAMDNGEVAFMNFPALLHFAQKRGVLLSAGHKKESRGFSVKSADQGEEFAGVLFAEPIDQGESSIRPGGMDQPTGRLVDNEETGIGVEDGGGVHQWERKFDGNLNFRISNRLIGERDHRLTKFPSPTFSDKTR